MKKHIAITAILAPALLSTPALAQSATPAGARSEIPVKEVKLSDGELRYSIPIKVGNTSIEVGLDTGSTGLRILPGTLPDADIQNLGAYNSYSYGSGTQLNGHLTTAPLTVGSLSAPATMQIVQSVSCKTAGCPADKVPADKFGIMGSGLPGEGFRAIMGVSMGASDVTNPFMAVGAGRWLVELPRPDSGTPGKIVLNPGDEEIKGFTMVPLDPNYSKRREEMHDVMRACIINVPTKDRTCGTLVLDTGVPNIGVFAAKPSAKSWADGSATTIAFYDTKGGLAAMEVFNANVDTQAAKLQFTSTSPTTIIGLSPYLAFDVLYDPANNAIGLKPRPAAPGAPAGLLASAAAQ